MPRYKRRIPYRQLTDFEWGYMLECVGMDFRFINSPPVWGLKAPNPGSWARNMMPPPKDRLLIYMAVSDRVPYSRALAHCLSSATLCLPFSAPTVRWGLIRHRLHSRIPLREIPLKLNNPRLGVQRTHQHSQ